MSGARKVVVGVILAAGIVSTVIVVRNFTGGRRRTPQALDSGEGVRAVSFRCGGCGTTFVGYEVERIPGTKPEECLFRYRRSSDKPWVPGTDKAKAAAIKVVTCPKCRADMRSLTFLGAAKVTTAAPRGDTVPHGVPKEPAERPETELLR